MREEMSVKSIFFAYEKGNQENLDAITKAAKELNKKQHKKCRVIRWEELSVSGKVISTDIFNNIKKCDKFACDLTYLNHNVLFELGFAIAQQKKLKIFLNPNIIDAKKNYSELKILKNIGYKEFLNAKDIIVE
jgi:nucleoside 2-deoxyribosyltransferase